jgi:hypothetical protein
MGGYFTLMFYFYFLLPLAYTAQKSMAFTSRKSSEALFLKAGPAPIFLLMRCISRIYWMVIQKDVISVCQMVDALISIETMTNLASYDVYSGSSQPA